MSIKYLLPPMKGGEITLHKNLDWNDITINPEYIEIPVDSSGVYDVSYFPTPWARLYMVDYSFRKFNQRAEAGLTAEEVRLINWTLDLLEIIFFRNVYDIKLEFEKVDPFPSTNYFGKANDLFWNYELPILIKEKLPNNTYRILGSTSPFSMVFPAYHRIKHHYPMGSDRKLFDPSEGKIILKERPQQFINYLIHLSKTLIAPSFAPLKTFLATQFPGTELLPDFHKQLETIDIISQEKSKNKLSILSKNMTVEFLCLKEQFFILESDYLVVSHDPGFPGTVFISDKLVNRPQLFSNNPIRLPINETVLSDENKKVLPGTVIRHPWITEKDLFSKKLLHLPYKQDAHHFQIGVSDDQINVRNNNRPSKRYEYLLPLTDTYFSICGFDGENVHAVAYSYDLIEAFGRLTAIVNIPLKGFKDGYSVKREYRDPVTESFELNVDDNMWYVSVFPNFAVKNKPDKSVGPIDYFIEQFSEGGSVSFPITTELEFYKGDFRPENLLKIESQSVRLKKLNRNSLSNYRVKEVPRLIRFTVNLGVPAQPVEGFLIPHFEEKEILNDEEYTCGIAADFGTSNSIVAVKRKDGDEAIILDYKNLNELSTIDRSLIGEYKNANLIYSDHSTKYFYNGNSLNSHLRSLICYSIASNDYHPYVDFNILLAREDLVIDEKLNKKMQEFKWKINNRDSAVLAERWVKSYVENLLLLTKYELIASGERINYRNINLKWFYPLAFSQAQKESIENIWREISVKVFPGAHCEPGIDESIPPFYDNAAAGSQMPIMNIDIGGGTTDICIMKGDRQVIKLSIPLAARNLTGDLYSRNDSPVFTNEIIRKRVGEAAYKNYGAHESFILALRKTKDKEEANIYIRETFRYSSIMVWFFYYTLLKYVRLVIEVHFPEKEIGNVLPGKIMFSGNGSRLIEALLRSEKGRNAQEELKDGVHSLNIMTSKVLQHSGEVRIEFNADPKAATVKGAFKIPRTIILNDENCNIVGENIPGYAYNTRLEGNSLDPSMPMISNSYVLEEFLPNFKKFVNDVNNRKIFINLSSEDQIGKLNKYFDRVCKPGNTVKILEYIQGGIRENGWMDSKVESSLLAFSLQGIINEMTREEW